MVFNMDDSQLRTIK